MIACKCTKIIKHPDSGITFYEIENGEVKTKYAEKEIVKLLKHGNISISNLYLSDKHEIIVDRKPTFNYLDNHMLKIINSRKGLRFKIVNNIEGSIAKAKTIGLDIKHLDIKLAAIDDGKVITIISDAAIKVRACQGLFAPTIFKGIDCHNLDISGIKNTSTMFHSVDLDYLDISTLDMSSVTDANKMFYDSCIKEIILKGINTSKLEIADYMFSILSSDKVIIDEIDTSNLKSAQGIFAMAEIKELVIKNIDTSNLENMSYMLAGCEIPTINLNHINTKSANTMEMMLKDSLINSLIADNFIIPDNCETGELFDGCEIKEMDLGNNKKLQSIFDKRRLKK